jgi:hypothetical protein
MSPFTTPCPEDNRPVMVLLVLRSGTKAPSGPNVASQGSTTSKHATALLPYHPLPRDGLVRLLPRTGRHKWWVATTVTLSAFLVVMNNARLTWRYRR